MNESGWSLEALEVVELWGKRAGAHNGHDKC